MLCVILIHTTHMWGSGVTCGGSEDDMWSSGVDMWGLKVTCGVRGWHVEVREWLRSPCSPINLWSLELELVMNVVCISVPRGTWVLCAPLPSPLALVYTKPALHVSASMQSPSSSDFIDFWADLVLFMSILLFGLECPCFSRTLNYITVTYFKYC